MLLLTLKEERDNSFEQLFEELVHMLNDPLKVKSFQDKQVFMNFWLSAKIKQNKTIAKILTL